MGTVIPLAKISPEEYVQRVASIRSQALAKARQKYLSDKTKLVVRTLKPSDLGLSGNEWTFNLSSGVNADKVSKSLNDKTMIVIFGIYNLSTDPQVTEVKFKTGSATVEDAYIEDMYLYDQPGVLLDEPVVYPPSSKINIDVVTKGANTAEKLGFLGLVIEPSGETITDVNTA